MDIPRRLIIFIVASRTFLSPLAADAVLISYDGFNYAPAGSDLLGNAGGLGTWPMMPAAG